MTGMLETPTVSPQLDRRGALTAAGACLAMLSQRSLAAPGAAGAGKAAYTLEAETDGMYEIHGIHDGKGTGKAKVFRFGKAPAPANFMIYDLPPGASEGVHVHFLDNRNREGSFDEYYYIVSGSGAMTIDGQRVPVKQGDHVHTPLEVAHGIDNTHATENLRIFLTYIQRGNEVWPAMATVAEPETP